MRKNHQSADERRQYKQYCSTVYTWATVLAVCATSAIFILIKDLASSIITMLISDAVIFALAGLITGEKPEDSARVQCVSCHRIYTRSIHRKCPKCGCQRTSSPM